MRKSMRYAKMFLAGLILVSLAACSSTEKAKPRLPLPLSQRAPQTAMAVTQQGTREYQSQQYQEAKTHFEQAVADAPDSGEAHYNLGLALFALGDTDQAREHFIQAANLAPGNKVIWDSPALRPFGAPEPNIVKTQKELEYSGRKGEGGGMIPRR